MAYDELEARRQFIMDRTDHRGVQFELFSKKFRPFVDRVMKEVQAAQSQRNTFEANKRVEELEAQLREAKAQLNKVRDDYFDLLPESEDKPSNYTSIAKVDLVSGKVLEKFPTIRAAARSVGGGHTVIRNHLAGQSSHAYGFLWRKIRRHKKCPRCQEVKHADRHFRKVTGGKSDYFEVCRACEPRNTMYKRMARLLAHQGMPRTEANRFAWECMGYFPQIKRNKMKDFVIKAKQVGIEESLKEYQKEN